MGEGGGEGGEAESAYFALRIASHGDWCRTSFPRPAYCPTRPSLISGLNFPASSLPPQHIRGKSKARRKGAVFDRGPQPLRECLRGSQALSQPQRGRATRSAVQCATRGGLAAAPKCPHTEVSHNGGHECSGMLEGGHCKEDAPAWSK